MTAPFVHAQRRVGRDGTSQRSRDGRFPLLLLEAHGAGLTLAPDNVCGEDFHVLINRCSYILSLASSSIIALCYYWHSSISNMSTNLFSHQSNMGTNPTVIDVFTYLSQGHSF